MRGSESENLLSASVEKHGLLGALYPEMHQLGELGDPKATTMKLVDFMVGEQVTPHLRQMRGAALGRSGRPRGTRGSRVWPSLALLGRIAGAFQGRLRPVAAAIVRPLAGFSAAESWHPANPAPTLRGIGFTTAMLE